MVFYNLWNCRKSRSSNIKNNLNTEESKNRINAMARTFDDAVTSSIKLLASKADFFSETHKVVKTDTVEQIDEVIADIKKFAQEVEIESKKMENTYSTFIHRLKELITSKEFLEHLIQIGRDMNARVQNVANQLLNQCKEHENRMLQEKIKILQRDK